MPETEAALRTVAQNVKSARTRAGLSLDELGRRAQVSKGALVALEKAQGNPNLATLVRLADALGISVSALMQGADENHVRVATATAIDPLWTSDNGGEARLMLTVPGPAPVEVWRWRLGPGDSYPSHPHQAGVHETISVLDGNMVLTLDGTEHPLAAGQTAAFPGDRPHGYHNPNPTPCDLIMTVHLPSTTSPIA